MSVEWEFLTQPRPGSMTSYGRAFRARQADAVERPDDKMAALMEQLFAIPWNDDAEKPTR